MADRQTGRAGNIRGPVLGGSNEAAGKKKFDRDTRVCLTGYLTTDSKKLEFPQETHAGRRKEELKSGASLRVSLSLRKRVHIVLTACQTLCRDDLMARPHLDQACLAMDNLMSPI